jgi:hypothetical protein
MSTLSLERNELLSRQASNEKFKASTEVPLAHRGKTLEEWTVWKKNWYEGTKTDIARAFEKLREKEARLRQQEAIVSSPSRHTVAEPLTAAPPSRHTVAEPLTAAPPSRHTVAEPPSQILLTKLNNEEYGMSEDPEIIKKDLIKFYIYYFTIDKYSKEVATQLSRTKQFLDDNWFIKNKDYKKPLEDLVRTVYYQQQGNINPDVDTINVIYNRHTNPPPPFSLPRRSSGGGHKSARRGKSKSKSRSKSRSRSRSRSKSRSKSRC